MSDYWDHPEYGKLEKELEKQVATTRKWMALHDEAVERETAQSCEGDLLKTAIATIAGQKLPKETSNPEDGDYEYAYEEIIKVARIASDAVNGRISEGQKPKQARVFPYCSHCNQLATGTGPVPCCNEYDGSINYR